MKIEIKQVILYAIVPALIAGFFSIAPKIYEVLLEPKAALSYLLVSGPQIEVENALQQVISVKITNSGKRPLTLIKAELSVDGGSVAAQKITNASGLSLQSTKTEDRVILTTAKLHPGEEFSISALLKTSKQSIDPKISLRSDEVLGAVEVPASPDLDFLDLAKSAGLATASVFAMAIFALRRVKRSILSVKSDAIFYIAHRIASKPLELYSTSGDEDLTYLRAADILYFSGIESDPNGRQTATLGLKCLLLIKDMHDRSKQIVENNLKFILQSDFNPEEIAAIRKNEVDSAEFFLLRQRIDDLVLKARGVTSVA